VAEVPLAVDRRVDLVQEAVAEGARRRRMGRLRRAAPAVALAASLLLVISAGLFTLRGGEAPPRASRSPRAPRVDTRLLSRPSNDLMGRPFQQRGAASRRLDLVFADRLGGYRRVLLGRQEVP
jgi:hypothetical protein